MHAHVYFRRLKIKILNPEKRGLKGILQILKRKIMNLVYKPQMP